LSAAVKNASAANSRTQKGKGEEGGKRVSHIVLTIGKLFSIKRKGRGGGKGAG